MAQGKGGDHHGIALFEYLHISNAGVGHVGVDSTGAMPAGPSPTSTTYGLVITESGAAEGEIVHTPLRRGHQSKSAQHHIHNTL